MRLAPIGALTAATWTVSGCDLLGSPETATIGVSFYGYASPFVDEAAVLTLRYAGVTKSYSGARTATFAEPQHSDRITLSAGQHVAAEVVLRASDGLELARATLSLGIAADWDYGVSFQVGGRNPDASGFCHSPPTVVPIPGNATDSLYLWSAGLPRGAIC